MNWLKMWFASWSSADHHLNLSDIQQSDYPIMFIKAISIGLIFFTFNISVAQTRRTSKHLKVLSANEMTWSPGIVQQNSAPAGGKVFEVLIKIKRKGDYAIEKMIVENESLDIEFIKDGHREGEPIFKKKSKWQVLARSNKKRTMDIPDPAIKKIAVEETDVAGWIQYKFKGQTFLRSIRRYEAKSSNSLVQ